MRTQASFHEVYINSADRIFGKSSNFVIQLPNEVFFNKCAITSALIPNSLYQFPKDTTLPIFFDDGGISGSNYNIPAGNYTVAQLTTLLKQILDGASNSFGGGSTFSVDFSPTTGKFTLTHNNSIPWAFYYTGGEQPSSLVLNALNSGAIKFDQNNWSSTYTTSFVNVRPIKRLQIRSRSIGGNLARLSTITTREVEDLVIATIPITSDVGSYNTYQSGKDTNSFFECRDISPISQLDISITDEDGNLVDLNGEECSLTLAFALE